MIRGLAIVIVSLLPCAGARALSAAANQAAAPTMSKELEEANRLSQQAIALYNEKKYSDAVSLEKRALAIREEALGPDHELVAASLNSLAAITLAEQNYGEAESHYKRLLFLVQKRWGPEAKQLIGPIEGLARTHFAQKEFGQSEKLYLRALAIREKTLGLYTLEMSESLENLGHFYERTERFAKAVDFYKRSLAIREKMLGGEDNQIVRLLHRCACSLFEVKQPEEAQKYRERAERGSRSNPLEKRGGLLQGTATLKFRPEYPAGVSDRGSVVVQVVVDECGRVSTANAVSGPQTLVPAAVGAAFKWRFTPTELGGRPVKVTGTITFNFTR